MAYIKFKELTHYFNFYKELDLGELPPYVFHYLTKGEDINAVYSTLRDKCMFTDRKIILFDRKGTFGITKKIHFFPYKNISSTAILFTNTKVSILLTMDSGYQLKLNFVKMNSENKTHLRKVYYKLVESIEK
jgi:hypothetical protein